MFNAFTVILKNVNIRFKYSEGTLIVHSPMSKCIKQRNVNKHQILIDNEKYLQWFKLTKFGSFV